MKALIVLSGMLSAAFSFANSDTVSAPGPVSSVEMYMGLPTFMVNGEPHMSTSFESYVPNERHSRQMSEAGATVFGFPANCGEEPYWHSTPTWVGEGVWDFSGFDEDVASILAGDPEALLMPRINVSEPEWWREENPGELMVFDDGTTDFRRPYRLWPAKESRTIASIASEKWRADMSRSLRRLIDHIQASDYADRIFGYQIFSQATEEWYHYTTSGRQLSDYSVHMQQAFRDWLKAKYGTTDALRRAWRDEAIDFSSAEIPCRTDRLAGQGERVFRDPGTEMHVIDFYAFFNEIIPETIDLFCGVVKNATEGTKVVGAFYAYMYEFCGNPESGHLAVQKLLESDNVDFIVVTASYGNRQLGSGGSIVRSPHTSLRLHNKLWFEDNDNVSFLFPEVAERIGDAEWERSKTVLAATEDAEESQWIFHRGAGFVLGNGVYQSLFDLHGGYFDHPELLKTVEGIYRLFEESAAYDRGSCSEILVVADERSTFYCTARSELLRQSLYDPSYRLIKCGAPYDSIYVNDLPLLDLSPYKLVIVLNAYCLDARQRMLLDERVKTSGRTVLWVYAPGAFEEGRFTPAGPADLTGIDLVISVDAPLAPAEMALESGTTWFTGALLSEGMKTMGPREPAGPLPRVTDTDAEVLARHSATGRPALVQKQLDDWTSVYSVTASLPSAFYRELAQAAGVHIYNERDDTLYVSQSYLTVNADGEGIRVLRFPEPVDVYDPLTNTRLASGVSEFSLNLRDKETRILRLDRQTDGKE